MSVVDLHRMPSPAPVVRQVNGEAWLVVGQGAPPTTLDLGRTLVVGDTLALAPHAHVWAGHYELLGGPHGRAHAFVAPDAFATSPALEELPELIRQLRELAGQLGNEDPLSDEPGPSTPYEAALARDFALNNLDLSWARKLTCDEARQQRAVPLFVCQDTAYVAVDRASVAKLLTLVQALGRPVNSHLMTPEAIDELLAHAYPP